MFNGIMCIFFRLANYNINNINLILIFYDIEH